MLNFPHGQIQQTNITVPNQCQKLENINCIICIFYFNKYITKIIITNSEHVPNAWILPRLLPLSQPIFIWRLSSSICSLSSILLHLLNQHTDNATFNGIRIIYILCHIFCGVHIWHVMLWIYYRPHFLWVELCFLFHNTTP